MKAGYVTSAVNREKGTARTIISYEVKPNTVYGNHFSRVSGVKMNVPLGWTIYPPALTKLIKNYSGNAEILTGKSNRSIEMKLAHKKPVVVLGFTNALV